MHLKLDFFIKYLHTRHMFFFSGTSFMRELDYFDYGGELWGSKENGAMIRGGFYVIGRALEYVNKQINLMKGENTTFTHTYCKTLFRVIDIMFIFNPSMGLYNLYIN